MSVIYNSKYRKYSADIHSSQALPSNLKVQALHIKDRHYINPGLGIILEDLHVENVLTRNNLFYFIDTVFYLTPDFYTS